MSKRNQSIVLTLTELMKRAHSNKGAQLALDRFHEIQQKGGKAEIRHDSFNLYSVIDKDEC